MNTLEYQVGPPLERGRPAVASSGVQRRLSWSIEERPPASPPYADLDDYFFLLRP